MAERPSSSEGGKANHLAKGRSQCQRRRQGARGRTRLSALSKPHRRLARKALPTPTHSFDHRSRLIGQEAWLRPALDAVLANTGARPAGSDGVTKRTVASEARRVAGTRHLRAELRDERFRPRPGRRVHSPQRPGKLRPLGLATRKDRVGPMLVPRGLDPLWERDVLNGSNGCRPRRRTMACLARLDRDINPRTRDDWVSDGASQGACDPIHQGSWLRLVAQRLADRRLLTWAARLRKAGVREGTLLRRTERGTPQGASGSPLGATVSLHQLARSWWQP